MCDVRLLMWGSAGRSISSAALSDRGDAILLLRTLPTSADSFRLLLRTGLDKFRRERDHRCAFSQIFDLCFIEISAEAIFL